MSDKNYWKFLLCLCPIAAAVLLGILAFVIVVAAGEDAVVSAKSFTLYSALAGFILGSLISLYIICAKEKRLHGFAVAIFMLIVPALLGGIAFGALLEGQMNAHEEREAIMIITAVTGWWLLIFIGAVAIWRGRKWGEKLQLSLRILPLLIIGGMILYGFVSSSVEPNSYWHGWEGVRAVLGLVGPLAAIVACIGLVKGDGGCIIFAGVMLALMAGGAALGQLLLNSIGGPVLGGFIGAFAIFLLSTGALVGLSLRDSRKKLRAAAENSKCLQCGTLLGLESLRLADEEWSFRMKALREKHPNARYRIVRRLHAICTACGANHEFFEYPPQFSLLEENTFSAE